MKTKFFLVMLLTVTALMGGCKFGRGVAGSGNRKTEKRELKSFKAIELNGAYTVNIACQKPVSFEIEADDNLLPLITTEVRDGVLVVNHTQEFHSSKVPTLRIALADLETLKSHGAGQIKITDVNNNQIGLDSDGAASLDASGTTRFIAIGQTGAGKIDTSNLHAEKAQVTVSGASAIDVYATEQLDVDISGVASVTYSGNPKTVNKHISGIGSINPRGQ